MNARQIVLELLAAWSGSRCLADELLAERNDIPARDRAFVQELFYGCLRQHLALDYLVRQLASRPPRLVVADILHLGLYQLCFLEKIPAHAAVNESVALAKQLASPAEAKFVNAILRRADRRLLATAPSWIQASHPEWLWRRWLARWGAADTLALGRWNNEPPPLYIRTLTSELPAGIPAVPSGLHPLAWRVTTAAGLFDGPVKFYAQDPSTLIAVDVLDPQPGEAVLDMCAAPGGKTTYIAQKMRDTGKIIAADSSNVRLGKVAENCQRLGVTIVATLACEGTRLDRCLRGTQFDRVLLDAPCSNTGVLRRRVDLRWRLQAEEIVRLAGVQAQLLAAASEFVKPGGVLVYSTCSLEPEENERVVERFRESHPKFSLDVTRSIFPPRDGMDGAFVAQFRRG